MILSLNGDVSPSFFAVIIGSNPQSTPRRSASARISLYCPTFCFMRGQFSLTVTPTFLSKVAPSRDRSREPGTLVTQSWTAGSAL